MAEFQVEVKMTEVEEIEKYMEITKKFINDKRIPVEVREEYKEVVMNTLTR